MKTYNEYNESLRDQMTGKSDKEVQLTLIKISYIRLLYVNR